MADKKEQNKAEEVSTLIPAPDEVAAGVDDPFKSVSPSDLKVEENTGVDGQQGEVKNGKQAKVNPKLDTASVTIPYGVDDNGVSKFHSFLAGKPYTVSADLLEKKNSEGVNLLVEDK